MNLRIALRSLARSRGFAAAATLTLALGIAASTTIFSVVYGVLLRPLPYHHASKLVVIQGEKAYSTGPRIMNFSAPELEPFAAAARAFSSIALWKTNAMSFRNDSGVESISSATVSGGFFSTLRTRPLAGRVLGDESEPNIVISERLWQQLFNRSPEAIGQAIRLTGWQNIERAYTVVGVMPHEFQYPRARTDVWKTLAFARAVDEERVRERFPGGHTFIARVRDGVSFDAARDDAARVVDTVLKPHFTTSRIDMYAKVTTLAEDVVGAIRSPLWILMGTVLLMLLVACANVANLILARQSTRTREISVRLALGAPRGRLLAYMLVDVAVLAAAAAITGVVAAVGGVRLLQWLQPNQLPRLDTIRVDVPVMMFACGVAIATVLIAGLIPALMTTTAEASLVMGSGSRAIASAGIARRLRSGLIVAEMAISIVLLVGALLLTRSLFAQLDEDIGVNTQNVIAVDVDMALGRTLPPERQVQIARDLEERIAALPGVRSAGFGSGVPPTGEYMRVSFILSDGRSTDSHMVTAVPASPGYFSTLQIRLVSGRLFTDADSTSGPPVVIVNREAARRFFGSDEPIGKTLPIMGAQAAVVGVVDNVKYTGIASGPEGVIYRPFAQMPMSVSVVLARTDEDPSAMTARIRETIRRYDAGISVPRIQPLTWWVSGAVAQPRFRAVLMSTIAAVTVLLAMIGLYGVMAYSTSRRTTEIGVRLAVGAKHSDIVRMVLGEGLRLSLAGAALGLLGAYWTSRLIGVFLYQVSPTDAAAFGGSALCLLGIALVATYIPARRAAHIEPAVALRTE